MQKHSMLTDSAGQREKCHKAALCEAIAAVDTEEHIMAQHTAMRTDSAGRREKCHKAALCEAIAAVNTEEHIMNQHKFMRHAESECE